MGFYGGLLGSNGIYPLVNIQKTMENHHFSRENQLFRLGHFNSYVKLPAGMSQKPGTLGTPI